MSHEAADGGPRGVADEEAVKRLNSEVTLAIVAAERADAEAAALWSKVAVCEESLVAALPHGAERDIAVQGAALARYKAAGRRRR